MNSNNTNENTSNETHEETSNENTSNKTHEDTSNNERIETLNTSIDEAAPNRTVGNARMMSPYVNDQERTSFKSLTSNEAPNEEVINMIEEMIEQLEESNTNNNDERTSISTIQISPAMHEESSDATIVYYSSSESEEVMIIKRRKNKQRKLPKRKNKITIIKIQPNSIKRVKMNKTKICKCGKDTQPLAYVLPCIKCKIVYHIDCVRHTKEDAKRHQYTCFDCDPNKVYKVEKIIGRRVIGRQEQFKVKWENYECTSWQSVKTLQNCAHLVNDYLKANNYSHVLPENTNLGTNPNMAEVPENWLQMSTILEEVKRAIKAIPGSEKWRLPVEEYVGDLESNKVYIYVHQNHAYVVRANLEFTFVADGYNMSQYPQIQEMLKKEFGGKLVYLNFEQQPSNNKCGTSAVLIAIEMMKPYIMDGTIDTIRVNKQHLRKLTEKYHKAPQENEKLNVKNLDKFICKVCGHQY